jgi:hypothetical protein
MTPKMNATHLHPISKIPTSYNTAAVIHHSVVTRFPRETLIMKAAVEYLKLNDYDELNNNCVVQERVVVIITLIIELKARERR